MSGVIRFIQSLILFAIGLALSGTLLEATGIVGRKAVQAHQHGGISFRWLNHQLLGDAMSTKSPKLSTNESK